MKDVLIKINIILPNFRQNYDVKIEAKKTEILTEDLECEFKLLTFKCEIH